MNKYTKEEVYEKTLEYFKGDTLATEVWMAKYALTDKGGNYREITPDDMHRRISREFAKIERRYPNPLSYDVIYDKLKGFKHIIPQGSPMFGIGNTYQTSVLGNCFVIGNDSDSYGGIFKTDQEQTQLMKNRAGVGHDLSHLRPANSKVNNAAKTSSGAASFMSRFSNSTREVSQFQRRGALMLSIDIKHPDVEAFIDAKLDGTKVTGANISVKISNEFMECVRENKPFTQQFPINSDTPEIIKEIDAVALWDKIMHNAWKSAEPGVLFFDNILKESIPSCYGDIWVEKSTNP